MAVYTIAGRPEPGASAAHMEEARRLGIDLELWELGQADLARWDYHTARESTTLWRRYYGPGIRVALRVQSRQDFATAHVVKAVVETEQLGVDFEVFSDVTAALKWLVSAAPPVGTSTIPAPDFTDD